MNWDKIFEESNNKLNILKSECLARIEKEKNIVPPINKIFRAFKETPFENLKVVILGQDPYYQIGVADGLCFSTDPRKDIPPSLKKIISCLKKNKLCINSKNITGCLINWARQGVLMLNTYLTTIQGKANCHKFWATFTDEVIKFICRYAKKEKRQIIFVLWGNEAKKKEPLINDYHIKMSWIHPSPLTGINDDDPRSFINCPHFLEINKILRERGDDEIIWTPMVKVSGFIIPKITQSQKIIEISMIMAGDNTNTFSHEIDITNRKPKDDNNALKIAVEVFLLEISQRNIFVSFTLDKKYHHIKFESECDNYEINS